MRTDDDDDSNHKGRGGPGVIGPEQLEAAWQGLVAQYPANAA